MNGPGPEVSAPAAAGAALEGGDGGSPAPLEFDDNGFPVAQPTPSLVIRVARLLSPS